MNASKNYISKNGHCEPHCKNSSSACYSCEEKNDCNCEIIDLDRCSKCEKKLDKPAAAMIFSDLNVNFISRIYQEKELRYCDYSCQREDCRLNDMGCYWCCGDNSCCGGCYCKDCGCD